MENGGASRPGVSGMASHSPSASPMRGRIEMPATTSAIAAGMWVETLSRQVSTREKYSQSPEDPCRLGRSGSSMGGSMMIDENQIDRLKAMMLRIATNKPASPY